MRNAGAVRRIGKGKSKLGRVTSARQEASLCFKDEFWGGIVCDCFECCRLNCRYAEAWDKWHC